jgi:hypothetical protein
MIQEKTRFMVIYLWDLEKSVICTSISEVAVVIKRHRNGIDGTKDKIYGDYMVLPRKSK